MTKPRVSIVVPVYYNELNLPDTIPQLRAIGASLPKYDLELVFVDDGSEDQSLALLREAQQRDGGLMTVVKLTRNFGTHAALQAGLAQATGDCIGIISADLQDPPELFVDMVKYWEQGTKVVLAVRADRDEPASQKMFAGTFYALMRRFALPKYPKGGFDFLLIDKQIVNDINNIREKNANLFSLVIWLGFQPVMLPYVRRRRTKGKSRWTFAKKVKLVIDSFIGYSYAPVRLMSVVGICTAASAFAYAGYVFLLWSLRGIPVPGYATIVTLIALTAGIQMLMLGVVGEYLWRMLDEVRRRPPYVIDWVQTRAGEVAHPETAAGGVAPVESAVGG